MSKTPHPEDPTDIFYPAHLKKAWAKLHREHNRVYTQVSQDLKDFDAFCEHMGLVPCGYWRAHAVNPDLVEWWHTEWDRTGPKEPPYAPWPSETQQERI